MSVVSFYIRLQRVSGGRKSWERNGDGDGSEGRWKWFRKIDHSTNTAAPQRSRGLYFRSGPSSKFVFCVTFVVLFSWLRLCFFQFRHQTEASKQTNKKEKHSRNETKISTLKEDEEKKVDFALFESHARSHCVCFLFYFLNQNLLDKIFTTKSISHLLRLYEFFFSFFCLLLSFVGFIFLSCCVHTPTTLWMKVA